MADASLGRAVLQTGLDQAGLKTGLQQAESTTRQSVQRLATQIGSLGRGLTVGVTAPIVAAGTAALAAAVKLGNYADRMLDMEQITGLSITTLQEFENVARVAGVSTDVLGQAAEGLTRRLRAAGPESKTFEDNINALGVSVRDSSGNLRDMDDLLPEIITGLQGIDNVTERNALSMQLLGRSAGSLAPVLGMTADEFKRAREEAHEMGQVLDRDALNAANNFRIEWEQLRAELGLAGREVQQALIPAMGEFVGVMRDNVIPIVKAAAERVAELIKWWSSLSPAAKTATAAMTGFAVAIGPVLMGVSGLLRVMPLLTGAMLPLVGPAGILLAATAGFIALDSAMDAGRQVRQDAQNSFDNLMNRMKAFRSELVITSEAERQAAQEALGRQRRVLEVTIQNQKAFIKSVEADVVAFANKGFFGQLFSFGAANVDIKALDQAEAHLKGLEQELKAINSSIDKISTMQIPGPGTDIPLVTTQVEELGAALDAAADLPDPAAAAKVWAARLAGELRFGIKSAADVFDILTPRVTELREEAAVALTEFGIESDQYADTVSKLEAIEGLLFRVGSAARGIDITPSATIAASVPLSVSPTATADVSSLRSPAMVAAELEQARAAQKAAGTFEEIAAHRADVVRLSEELDRLTTGVKLTVGAFAEVTNAVSIATPQPFADVGSPRALASGAFATVDSTGLRSLAEIRSELQQATRDLEAAGTHAGRLTARALVNELQRELDEGVRLITPVALTAAPWADVGEPRGLSVDPFAKIIPDDALDPAAQRFAETVVAAGFSFGNAAIQAFQDGDVAGVIQAGLSGAGSILGGADLGSVSFLGGSIGIGSLISGGLGLLGTLIGALAGGGSRDAEDRRRREQQQARSVPAISINFQVTQHNQYNGAPSDPVNEQAFSRQADALFESIYRRHLGPRLDRIEQRLGIAGA